MKRFILVHGDSAAGNLKAARIADRVMGVLTNLVAGPAPDTTDMADFYGRKYSIAPEPEPDKAMGTPEIRPTLDKAMSFNRFELWFGPDPEAQLGLLQIMLEMATSHPTLLARATLVSPSKNLGVAKPEWTRAQTFPSMQIDNALIAYAQHAWSAWCAPTPEAWRALMDEPVGLPLLAPVISRLLKELPDSITGLSFSQSRLLQLVGAGTRRPIDLFGLSDVLIGDPSYDYFTLGQILLDMFHGPAPLLQGTTETIFSVDMHQDRKRHEAFFAGEIALTSFGHDVMNGRADYLAAVPVDAYWGGTHLTNDNLWRWNAETKSLIAP